MALDFLLASLTLVVATNLPFWVGCGRQTALIVCRDVEAGCTAKVAASGAKDGEKTARRDCRWHLQGRRLQCSVHDCRMALPTGPEVSRLGAIRKAKNIVAFKQGESLLPYHDVCSLRSFCTMRYKRGWRCYRGVGAITTRKRRRSLVSDGDSPPVSSTLPHRTASSEPASP